MTKSSLSTTTSSTTTTTTTTPIDKDSIATELRKMVKNSFISIFKQNKKK
jgi:hypothetical protein